MLASSAFAQLSNFIVTDSYGVLYEVDGDTLESTVITELISGRSISEVLYVGNDEILSSTIGGYARYNLRTGVETIEFFSADILPNPSFQDYTMAAGFTSQRNVYFGVAAEFGEGFVYYGMLYNPFEGTFTEMAELEDSPSGLYFDFIEVGNNLFLAADWGVKTARTINIETGETIAEFSTQEGVVSFMTLDGEVFALTREADLYYFDLSSGAMELYGNITGLQRSAIGATSMTVPQTSDINYDGSRDFIDVIDFLDSFEAREPVADWNDDGIWDFYDVSAFVTYFTNQ